MPEKKEEIKEPEKKEEIKEPEKKEEIKEPEKREDLTVPDPDHKERSELGRKVKALQDEIPTLHAKIDQLLQQTAPKGDPDPYAGDWEVPQTKEELDTYLESRLSARESARTKAEREYGDAYLATINTFRDDENFADICDEIQKNHNIRHSNNGKMDARLNFMEAAASVLKKKTGGNIPLKGKDNDLPLGGGGGDAVIKDKEVQLPEFDEITKAYIKERGWTDAQVAERLKKPLPPGIGGLV